MKRVEVVNLNRGTRIHAGIEVGDLLIYGLSGLFTYLALSGFIHSTTLCLLGSGATAYATYVANTIVKDRYGPGFVPDFLSWIFTPNQYVPDEDPDPSSILVD